MSARPAIATPKISIPLGPAATGEPVFVQIYTSQPFTQTMLRRLARHLEFMADEWDRADEDESEAPNA